jgi:hypothetical protein
MSTMQALTLSLEETMPNARIGSACPPRTFLVIPDAYNGGADFECFVVAASPEEACQHVAKYLDCDSGFKLEPDAPYTDEQRDELWIVRELSAALRATPPGVVPWAKLQCTFWRVR